VTKPNRTTEPSGTDAAARGLSRRTLLAAMAGGAGVAAAGPGAQARPPARRPGQSTAATGAASGRVQPQGETPSTVEGEIRAAPVAADGRLLVGTSRGLYVLSAGDTAEIETFVPTQPISAVEPVDENLVIVLVEDRFFPNVLAIDPATGERRWTASRTVTVYNQEFGEVERQAPVFDAVGLDETSSGGPDVAVAMGYSVVAFDGESGDRLWAAETDFYTWQVATQAGTVYASTQDGRVLGLDASSGTEQFSIQVAEPYDMGGNEIHRSVWNVLTLSDDGPGDLAVTTEDGYLKLVSAEGSVVAETRLLDPDDEVLKQYYQNIDERPTTGGGRRTRDENFFNLDATPVEGGFVVRVHEPRREQPVFRLAFVDRSGESQWTNETVELAQAGNLLYDPAVDPNAVFVPGPPREGQQSVARVGLDGGSDAGAVEFPTVPGRNPFTTLEEIAFAGAADGTLVVTSTSADVSLVDPDSGLVDAVPSVRDGQVLRADFLGDGVEDTLVFSRNRRRGRLSSRTLVLRSGEDGSVVWTRTLGPKSFQRRGGFRELRVIDTPGEGVGLLALRPADDEGEQPAELLAISGQDGTDIRRMELTVEQQVGPEETRTRPVVPVSADVLSVEGEPDGIAVVGGREQFLLVDLANRQIIFQRWYNDSPEWPPLDSRPVGYRAVDGPGQVDDLVAVAAEEPALQLVETSAANQRIQFEPAERIDLQGNRIVRDSIEVLTDHDDDGYPELTLLVDDEGRNRQIVALGSGAVVASFQDREGLVPSAREVPGPSGDGPGLLTTHNRGDELAVTLFEGLEQRWQLATGNRIRGSRRSQGVLPAAPAGDVDDDGTEEVAVAWYGREGGAKVDLYNVAEDERVETIQLERFGENVDPEDDDLAPAIRVERLPDRTGDGRPELGVVVGQSFSPGDFRFYIVDPAEGRVLVSGEVGESEVVPIESSEVGVVGSDASLRTVDVTGGVSLTSPESATELDLAWEFDDDRPRVTTVRANQRPVTITSDQSATVRLPAGTHEIEVRARAPDGIVSHDSATVSVDGGSLAATVLYAAAGASVLSLFGFGLVERLRRWRER
jgi:hypothetical protein